LNIDTLNAHCGFGSLPEPRLSEGRQTVIAASPLSFSGERGPARWAVRARSPKGGRARPPHNSADGGKKGEKTSTGSPLPPASSCPQSEGKASALEEPFADASDITRRDTGLNPRSGTLGTDDLAVAMQAPPLASGSAQTRPMHGSPSPRNDSQGRVGDAYSSLGPERAASVRDFRTLGARVNPRAAGTRTGSCPAQTLGRRQASNSQRDGAGRASTIVQARRAPLHNNCGEARRRAAGGVVASRAARQTKTLPATDAPLSASGANVVTQYEARSGFVSTRTLRTTCHGKGRFTNRLYLALVAARRLWRLWWRAAER
jgi:hypothetical protein